MNIKNPYSLKLDIVYHNSPLLFWLHAFQRRRHFENGNFRNFHNSVTFNFIRSYGIPSFITHRPLPTN